MPWLLSEDAALKYHLQGLTCSDPETRNPANAGKYPGGVRNVPVRYRLPEDEIATMNFPIIIIDPPRINPAHDREHRCHNYRLPYAPEGYDVTWDPTNIMWDALPYQVPDVPIPFNLDYQITLLCRLAREHFYPLMAGLAGYDYIPARFGYLNVPQDSTIRSLDLIGGPDTGTVTYAQKDGNNKRLFRATYLVRVYTELPGPITNILQYPPVSEVDIDLKAYADIFDLTSFELEEAVGIAAAVAKVGWNSLQND